MLTQPKTFSNPSPQSKSTARQLEILTLCKTKPRMIQELANYFNTSYATVYKDVELLKKIGQLKASSLGTGSKATYWETTESYVTKGLRFHTKKDSLTIDQLVGALAHSHLNSIKEKFMQVAASVATLYLKAQRKSEGFEVGPEITDLKRIVLDSHEAIKQMSFLIEQLLTAPIWEDNEDALKLLSGLEDYPDLLELSDYLTTIYANKFYDQFREEDSQQKKSD